MVEVRRLAPSEAEARFDELAQLRIEVFRDYPYLYDGDVDYERRYLDAYMKSAGAVIVGAFDGAGLVGAATAAPLADHFEEFAEPFAERGLDPALYYYFGESILRKSYRGRGVGVRFFVEREDAAREAGFERCLFASVVRPPDHPSRPVGYEPLDGFWARRGYARIEGLRTGFSWRDVGDTEETVKPMEYWSKEL